MKHTRALAPALLLAMLSPASEAATITSIQTFALPGFSTGSLTFSLPGSPNNDNAPTASPNTISYSIFFNAGGLAPAYLEFNVANSGGTTEYQVAPFGFGVVNNTGVALAGFRAELGYGAGANFVLSGAADGLDFDTPDRDPAPVSVRFPTVNHQPDAIVWSGAVAGLGQIGSSFAIDVPDGIERFTLRLTPAPVPEPSSAALALAGLAAVGLRVRRFRRKRRATL